MANNGNSVLPFPNGSASNRLLNLAKALLTNGRDTQSFIGAKWLVGLLRITPVAYKRDLALRILAVSPHYFYRSFRPEYQGMPLDQFLNAEFERNQSSRERIASQLLAKYLKLSDVALEIGCGPGFLARAVAPYVKKVYACDISAGVLECARVVNGSSNIQYLYSGDSGFAQIPDGSLDVAYSFATIQHLRESIIKSLFMMAGKKVRPGGRCVFQVQLDDGKWVSESDQTADHTLIGQLKFKYGLNFFSRSENFFRELAAQAGFSVADVCPVSDYLTESFDDVCHQHLLILSKN